MVPATLTGQRGVAEELHRFQPAARSARRLWVTGSPVLPMLVMNPRPVMDCRAASIPERGGTDMLKFAANEGPQVPDRAHAGDFDIGDADLEEILEKEYHFGDGYGIEAQIRHEGDGVGRGGRRPSRLFGNVVEDHRENDGIDRAGVMSRAGPRHTHRAPSGGKVQQKGGFAVSISPLGEFAAGDAVATDRPKIKRRTDANPAFLHPANKQECLVTPPKPPREVRMPGDDGGDGAPDFPAGAPGT